MDFVKIIDDRWNIFLQEIAAIIDVHIAAVELFPYILAFAIIDPLQSYSYSSILIFLTVINVIEMHNLVASANCQVYSKGNLCLFLSFI